MSSKRFGGLAGVLAQGVARRGHPAQARIQDHHGNIHYVHVEPWADGDEIRVGASADAARAEATKAAEAIVTAREVAEAGRNKEVALIEAKREAEREAAVDRAEAQREEAQAEADAIAIRAEAKKKELLAEAVGQRAIVDAENALSAAIVDMKVALARLEALPRIVAEMVKPAEKIDSIKIHTITGLNGDVGNGSGANGDAAKTPVKQALDSILGMAVQLPAMKKIGEEAAPRGMPKEPAAPPATDHREQH